MIFVSHRHRYRDRGGYAALTSVLFVVFSSFTLIGALTFLSFQEVRINRAFLKSVDARAAADSGVEDALWRIMSGKQISSSEVIATGIATATVAVETMGTVRTIRSSGEREQFRQAVSARIEKPSIGPGFSFGAHVGDGGLEMGNNSSVSGGVFSNGSIKGDNGAVITGDAFAAGTSSIENVRISRDARARLIKSSAVGRDAFASSKIDDTTVARDARAHELDDATISRDAYYTIVDDDTTVAGSRITPSQPPADAASAPMPIADETIQRWKNDASAKGVIASGTCAQDWSPPTSTYTVDGGVIERNLKIENNKTLILKGTVWVKCAVDVSGGGAVRLHSSYGAASGVLIADQRMHFQNNGAFQGSGTAGSYILILTTASSGGHHGSAIDLHNNASGAIFYAASGLVYLHQNVTATQLSGRTVHMENNTTLQYDAALPSTEFASGSLGTYDMKYWKETE